MGGAISYITVSDFIDYPEARIAIHQLNSMKKYLMRGLFNDG